MVGRWWECGEREVLEGLEREREAKVDFYNPVRFFIF